MNMHPLTSAGQIKEGNTLLIEADFCDPFQVQALMVIEPGSAWEEIVYNRKKNHYFITSMVLDGTSRVKKVQIIRAKNSNSHQIKPEE